MSTNRIGILVFLTVALAVVVGCDSPAVVLDKPVVTTQAIENGTVLRLMWVSVTDAESYEITTDDSVFTTKTAVFDVSTPSESIEVRAVRGNNRSDPAVIDCGVVETSSVVIDGWSLWSPYPNPKSGLALGTDGAVAALPLTTANWAAIDYVCDADDFTPAGLVNAGDHSQTPNGKFNMVKLAGGTSYDSIRQAPESGFVPMLTFASNGVYSLWLRQGSTWSILDHFAKIHVQSIQRVGDVQKVTLKIGYQKIGGLRWLMN